MLPFYGELECQNIFFIVIFLEEVECFYLFGIKSKHFVMLIILKNKDDLFLVDLNCSYFTLFKK